MVGPSGQAESKSSLSRRNRLIGGDVASWWLESQQLDYKCFFIHAPWWNLNKFNRKEHGIELHSKASLPQWSHKKCNGFFAYMEEGEKTSSAARWIDLQQYYKYNRDHYCELGKSYNGLITNKAYNCWKILTSTLNSKILSKCYEGESIKKLKNLEEGSKENEVIFEMADHKSWQEHTNSFKCCKDILRLARSSKVSSLRLNVLVSRVCKNGGRMLFL